MYRQHIPHFLALAGVFLAVACGPAVRVDPLIGEDPELLRGIATSIPDLREHGPGLAARGVYQAIAAGDMDAVWNGLSKGTREALDAAAGAKFGSGRALLEHAATEGLPLVGEDGETVSVPIHVWLFSGNVRYFRLTLDPEDDEVRDEKEAVLYAIDPSDRYRELHLLREDGGWHLHHPTLRLADTPGALAASGAKTP